MSVVVTDTGPLLYLHQVRAMHLLARLGSVQVTPTVWSELQRHSPRFATSGLPAWLSQVHMPDTRPPTHQLFLTNQEENRHQ